MTARSRIIVAALAGLLAARAPALAQDAAVNSAAPASNEIVGPPQLRDFSLNGTVTRPAPEPAPQQPQQRRAPASPAATQSSTAQPPTQPRSGSAPAARVQPPRPRAPAPLDRAPDQAGAIAAPPLAADSGPAIEPVRTASSDRTSGGPVPMLAWIIAALAIAGAAAWFLLRRRQRETFAFAGAAAAFDSPAPPAPKPAAPRAAPEPAPTGIVSTRLRPWLEIEFKPQRGVIDDERAAIAFELSVYNSGPVPARDVLLEASLFNAGAAQDQQIALFFDNPVAKGDRIAVIPPMQRITVNTAVFLARDQVRPFEVEGRTLFVPVIAFNALYGWGGGTGQTSASYVVGKKTGGEKLAPFRLDLGPRIFRNLDAREHELGLRK